MIVSRLVQFAVALAVFFSTIANATSYSIELSFASGAGQPTRVVLENSYCMSSAPATVELKDGYGTFTVDTSGGVFSKCGYVHSSATYVGQDSQKKTKVEFEFYKPYGGTPSILIFKGASCASGRGVSPDYDYTVDCGTLGSP